MVENMKSSYCVYLIIWVIVGTSFDAKGGEFIEKLKKFYDLTYPTRIANPRYSNVFRSDLSPKIYDLSGVEGRSTAYFDAGKLLADDLQPKILELDRVPINSIYTGRVLFDSKSVVNEKDKFTHAASFLVGISAELHDVERLVLLRDIWVTITAFRSGKRMYNRKEFLGIYDDLVSMENILIDAYNEIMGTGDFSQYFEGRLIQHVAFSDVRKQLGDTDAADYLKQIESSAEIKSIPLNTKWSHVAASKGASFIRIWSWEENAGESLSFGAMLVRTALLPKDAATNKVYLVDLVEEVFISGVGRNIKAEKSSNFPWHLHFSFDRDKLIKSLKLKERNESIAYMDRKKDDDIVFLGFFSDTVGAPPRGGNHLATSTISCIECHGGLGKPRELPLLYSRDTYEEPTIILEKSVDSENEYILNYKEFFR